MSNDARAAVQTSYTRATAPYLSACLSAVPAQAGGHAQAGKAAIEKAYTAATYFIPVCRQAGATATTSVGPPRGHPNAAPPARRWLLEATHAGHGSGPACRQASLASHVWTLEEWLTYQAKPG